MSFLYPRTIGITRPTQPVGFGNVGYAAELPSTEEAVTYAGIPASIQFDKSKGMQDAKLPGDSGKTLWKIMIPSRSLAVGSVVTRDVVTDDAGVRYQVVAPYWNSLGYNLLCELMES